MAFDAPPVRTLTPSATLAIQQRTRELVAEGRHIYRLGLGQSPFPVPRLVIDALRANAAQKEYLPVEGLPALRAAVADYHRRRHFVSSTADDVLVAPGSKELMFLIQLVLIGTVMIPTPAWVSYAPQARILGKPIHFIRTQRERGWLLEPDELEACCRQTEGARLLVLNYPSNPTGNSYGPVELERLAEVARRHDLIVLSDEIYGELDYEGRHASMARFLPDSTIVSSGLSKWCGAGGWRLGTFLFPRRLRPLLNAMAAAASETYTSTSAPIQHAAVRAFEPSDEIASYVSAQRKILAALVGGCAAELTAAGARLVTPRGSFYLFPDFEPFRELLARRGITTSQQLAERLLTEAGVAALPGVDFGLEPELLAIRLALVDFDGARALSAVQGGAAIDEAFLEEHCRASREGVRQIIDFVRAE
jgi:aspartate aminotransferase